MSGLKEETSSTTEAVSRMDRVSTRESFPVFDFAFDFVFDFDLDLDLDLDPDLGFGFGFDLEEESSSSSYSYSYSLSSDEDEYLAATRWARMDGMGAGGAGGLSTE